MPLLFSNCNPQSNLYCTTRQYNSFQQVTRQYRYLNIQSHQCGGRKHETGHMDTVSCNTNKMFFLYIYYVVYFSFRKRASTSLVLWFFVPENNDTPRVTTPQNIRAPKAANSKSNQGRYHGNFPVFSFVNQTYSNRTESDSIHLLSSM